MASSAIQTIVDTGWTDVVTDAAESLLTSDGNGFMYVVRAALPDATLEIGHVVDGFTNETIVTLDGETLYVRSRHGSITLVTTTDVEA